MYNDDVPRAVLAERGRDRDSSIHVNAKLDRGGRRGFAHGLLARLLGRRWRSGGQAGITAPARIAIEIGDGLGSPPAELRASQR